MKLRQDLALLVLRQAGERRLRIVGEDAQPVLAQCRFVEALAGGDIRDVDADVIEKHGQVPVRRL